MTDLISSPSPLDDPRSVQMAEAMQAEGVVAYEKVQVDFFAPVEDVRTFLPDGISYIQHKQLMEGDRKRYLKAVQRDMKIQKGTGDAIMRLAAGEERTALLRVAITGWNLIRNGQALPFTPQNVELFLDSAPVMILETIEKAVRKNNPWLFADATVADIDEQIAELQELRIQVAEREQGN